MNNIKEEVNKIRDEYEEKLSDILSRGIDSELLKVKGEAVGLEILTVELYTKDDSFITEIWVGNYDKELSSIREYNFEANINENVKKRLYDYIVKNVNKD